MESNIVAAELQKALLNSVSHNLRAPLASITGILDSLLEDDPLDAETRRELLLSARDEAERLNRLVGNLLEMTRLEGGAIHLQIEPCDLRDAVESALTQIGDSRAGGRVSVHVPPDLPAIPMDLSLISQTLVNLIDNALSYSGERSPVELLARLEDDHVRISVVDHGRGIAPHDLPRVFEKFYSCAPHGSGVGLGLSICKGFVEAHGGSIRAENGEHGGAVVSFTLPMRAAGGAA